jgi:hypothetical protein
MLSEEGVRLKVQRIWATNRLLRWIAVLSLVAIILLVFKPLLKEGLSWILDAFYKDILLAQPK